MKHYHFMIRISYLSAFGVMLMYFRLMHQAKYVNVSDHLDLIRDIYTHNTSEERKYRKYVQAKYYYPRRNPAGINCSKLINHDKVEVFIAKTIMSTEPNLKPNLTSEFYLNITQNCNSFRKIRGYIQHPLSKEEYEFPLAFSILAYTDIEQVERLLRLVYRPHNYYCIHIDAKMNMNDKTALIQISNCLPNVFIAKESINVTWGKYTIIEAELACMKTLWPYKAWKYYINLTGQEFPLKTNRQIVSILKVLEGANVVEGHFKAGESDKIKNRIAMKKDPPPHGIQLTKGSMHIAANRFYIDFCLHDVRARDFLEWLKPTLVPDEIFFSSLNHNPHLGIRGSFLGNIEKSCLKPFFLRFVIWKLSDIDNCHGIFVRNVCVLGVEDLFKAYHGIELFANKFHLDYEHLALDCLEEMLYDLTWREYVDDLRIDVSYFKRLYYVKMHLKAT